jgi:hypothetical protein
MIKIIIQEEKPVREIDDEGFERVTKETHLVTTHEAMSEDKQILAALLRGIANRWDPPKER